MITAPFNFVPLNKEVFFPDWADSINHDVPFENSQSGVINIKITAKSPIFVRNHSSDRANPSEEFCNHNGDYYIPSTSVKGMIRSVLEVMSFSKMKQFDDDTYAVRDLRDKKLYMSKMTPEKISCGWLKKTEDGFFIEDCGRAGRIKHEEIDKIFNINFASKYKKGAFKNKAADKMAEKKYVMLKDASLTHTFKQNGISTTGDKRYVYDKTSSLRGTIVLTGQPSARDESRKIPSGKVYEFVFFEPKREIKVSQEAMKNFYFAYFDERDTEPKESTDWTFWKKKLKKGEKVPVFFQKSETGVAHFGLSYLYKLPYNHSIKDGVAKIHFAKKLDLAESIFGYVDDKESLKGRAVFSHFKATSGAKVLPQRTEILGTPRASYYPMYVLQEGELFTTYMDEFSIAGRKRYPIHKSNKTATTEKNENENVGTTFSPLSEGVVFEGKLRYHNLKKVELGALLSALMFHDTQGTYHNIGMAKSLGYGKVELKISGIENIHDYMKAFELEMESNTNEWAQSKELKELFAMATEQNNSGNSALRYMSLPEFADHKSKTRDCLRRYTELTNIVAPQIKNLLTSQEIEEETQRLKEEQEKQEKEQRLKEELQSLKESKNLQRYENFIKNNPEHPQIEELIAQKDALQKAQEQNKHQKVNDEAQKAWEGIHDPKYKANLKKSLQNYIKKWEAAKNNKGSEYVLELVEKAKAELK